MRNLAPYTLALLALLLLLLTANLVVVYGTSRAIDSFVLAASAEPERIVMAQEGTVLETSWCWVHDEGGQSPEHTKVTVTTVQHEGESDLELKARHLGEVAAKKQAFPDNCPTHEY